VLVQITLNMKTERDSPRDQLVVTLFLLTVFGLLLVAGIKTRIAKAGIAAELPWHNGRRWWEVRFLVLLWLEKHVLSRLHKGLGSGETRPSLQPGANASGFRL